MEIRFRAGVGHAHALELEALTQKGGVAGFVSGGGAEGETDIVKGKENGGTDDGVRMTVEASGELAYKVSVSMWEVLAVAGDDGDSVIQMPRW